MQRTQDRFGRPRRASAQRVGVNLVSLVVLLWTLDVVVAPLRAEPPNRERLDSASERLRRLDEKLRGIEGEARAIRDRLAGLKANFDDAAPATESAATQKDRDFWSFRPLTRHDPPTVTNDAWVRTPIDRFILARMDEQGLAPNAEANRRKLIRRASLDLRGLPPDPEELQRILDDERADWYERMIDRFLASPRFGERWARHWLDVARFAESHGYEQDYDREYAYHYRDFVIRAINDDLPYDTFVRWQLAGDEIAPDDAMAMTATGFLAAGVHSTQITKNQVEKERYDELDDMLRTTGTAFLGLTIGCARCHNHKYDPISTNDYYRMLSTFTRTVRANVDVNAGPAAYEQSKRWYDARHEPMLRGRERYEENGLEKNFQKWLDQGGNPPDETGIPEDEAGIIEYLKHEPWVVPPELRAKALDWYRPIDPEWKKLTEKIENHRKETEPRPDAVKALVASEGITAVRNHTQGGDFLEETHFLRRGDPNQKLEVATQSFLAVLMRTEEREARWRESPPEGWHTSYQRRSLANWITDVDRGAGHLLARVIVNRIWQHHLGRGIVATPSDFGMRGERPTHPELLDWLATELIDNAWSLKHIHRLILTSAVYRQSSDRTEAATEIDPENQSFWRYNRRRLEAETIRDSMLAAGGLLDEEMFGPGSLDPGNPRRSIYLTIKRSRLIPMMVLFDAPDSTQSIGARSTTTIAPQALALMNNRELRKYAEGLAERALSGGERKIADGAARAWEIALGRPPTTEELENARGFIEDQSESYRAAGNEKALDTAMADLCQVLMSLNEFVYLD